MATRSTRPGFTLIELVVVIGIVGILGGLLLVSVQRARAASARLKCSNNLRQIGIALQCYHDARGHYPPSYNNWTWNTHDHRVTYKYQGLTWMTLLLPYIDQKNLWDQTEEMQVIGSHPPPVNTDPFPYNWSNPGDRSPDGVQRYLGLGTALGIYACPADSRTLDPQFAHGLDVGLTSYLAVLGTDLTAWSLNAPSNVRQAYRALPGVLVPTNKYDFDLQVPTPAISTLGTRMAEIRDGASNTVVVGERPPSSDMHFGWWFAGVGQRGTGSTDNSLGTNELNLQNSYRRDVNACPEGPYDFRPGTVNELCDMFHYWSLHSGGGNFLFADGTVRFLAYDSASILPDLASRNGGEVLSPP